VVSTFPNLTPSHRASYITDSRDYFVSPFGVYRILRRHDLITSPQTMVMSASVTFQYPTRSINELSSTDFTYFRVLGWSCSVLSTVLNDYSRCIVRWRQDHHGCLGCIEIWRMPSLLANYRRPKFVTRLACYRVTGLVTSATTSNPRLGSRISSTSPLCRH